MDFIKLICVNQYSGVTERFIAVSEIRYVDKCEFVDPRDGVKYPNCLNVKTHEEFDCYLNLDGKVLQWTLKDIIFSLNVPAKEAPKSIAQDKPKKKPKAVGARA